MKKLFGLVMLFILIPLAVAEIDFEQELTAEEKDQVDDILTPILKIYNVIKYSATVIGVLVLVFAGVTFLTSGGDKFKKDKAKNMGMGVVIGLIVIWVAPLIVQFIFS